ncbi:MAG TPA: gliding motility-associated C-terminal domain-containing protein, partial [Chitinophagales bacterium]|nr:gliding motility-associated C-terminal domain-containing protein [Chitinophagales bacterium]
CDPLLGCQYAAHNCDDADACTDDSCDPVSGCQYAAHNCDDADACTDDSCDPLVGCQYATHNCDDADACTDDTCIAGTCLFPPVICDDVNTCTTDSCLNGACIFTPVICDDGDVCTADSCVNGSCVFTVIPGCTNPCDTLLCDDADLCTADTCMNGLCLFTPVICDDSTVCTNDVCINGECEFTPVNLNVTISPSFDTINKGDVVQLIVNSDSVIAFYDWSPAQSLSCSTCESPIASPESTTLYTLIVTGANGCTGTAASLLVIQDTLDPNEPCFTSIYVPNAFSPNGDGYNDQFNVMGRGITEMHLRVYNRWGELIFETRSMNLTDGWDGTYKGKPLNPDVFVYHVEVVFCDGTRLISGSPYKKGSVTLLR